MNRFRGAFTLVELLVVVAIIGILMSILLPAVSNVQRTAKIAACANQVRQIALAINNFAQDNRDALYNNGYANPVNSNGFTNIAGLVGDKANGVPSYLTRDSNFDPALPKDYRYHTGNTSQVSFYSVVPIVGLRVTNGAPGTTLEGQGIAKFTKFSQIPNDKAVVMDLLRLVHQNVNHPAPRNGPPTFNLAFRDGSVSSVNMPRELWTNVQLPTRRVNQWWVHNDVIRVLELSAKGRDPSRVPGNPNPWPFATSPNPNTHSYIPIRGDNTRDGKAHALTDL